MTHVVFFHFISLQVAGKYLIDVSPVWEYYVSVPYCTC